jgi:replicative DNA helicase
MTQDTKIFPLNQQQDGEIISISPATEICSREAEQSLLGGLILNDKAWPEVSKILTATDFTEKRHQLLWTAISNVIASGAHPDIITVTNQLKKDGNLKTVNGNNGYLGLLINNTTPANIIAYTKIIRETSLKRDKMNFKQALLNAEGEKEAELLTKLKAANDALEHLKNQCGESLFDQAIIC